MFSNNSSKKRKLWLSVVLSLAVLGLVIPFHHALAFLNPLANLIANAAFGLLSVLVATLARGSIELALWVLRLVTSENFINWSFTGPDNPLIAVGWTLSRDLTNMAFIIILVYIGLSTALRLGEQNAKRALPTLILVALLINFTPVLLGVVIDASNIVMNFFLGKIAGGLEAVGRAFVDQLTSVIQVFLKQNFSLMATPTYFFVVILMMVSASLTTTIIYLFALLFMMRYVALWVLVILSPIAFASYILPQTKGVWNQWWRQFIQWCLIGIFAAFFLYLGNHLMVQAPNIIKNIPFGETDNLVTQTWLNYVRTMMPYTIPVLFLIYGFFTALSTSAVGASGLIRSVQRTVKGAPKWLAKRQAVKNVASDVVGTTGSLLNQFSEGYRQLSEKGDLGKVAKVLLAPTVGVAAWASRYAATGLTDYAAGLREPTLPKNFDKATPDEQYMMAMNQSTDAGKIYGLDKMASLGTLDKVSDREGKLPEIRALMEKVSVSRFAKKLGTIGDAVPEVYADVIFREKMEAKKIKIDAKKTAEQIKKEAQEEIDKVAKDITVKATVNVDLHAKIAREAGARGMTEQKYIHDVLATERVWTALKKMGAIERVVKMNQFNRDIEKHVADIRADAEASPKLKREIQEEAAKKGITYDQHLRNLASMRHYIKNMDESDRNKIGKTTRATLGFRVSTPFLGFSTFQKTYEEGGSEAVDKLLSAFDEVKDFETGAKLLDRWYRLNPKLISSFNTTQVYINMAKNDDVNGMKKAFDENEGPKESSNLEPTELYQFIQFYEEWKKRR